jgi:hypothetical protein
MNKRLIRILIVCFIILFALLIRLNTFWFSHINGDELFYVSLAMKLDELGLRHYNPRGIKISMFDIDKQDRARLAYFLPAKDPDEEGDVLEIFSSFGVHYYDMPFFHKPYGFPYALVLSHKLFTRGKQPYTVVAEVSDTSVVKEKPHLFLKVQFYAVVVPLFFSLGLVFLSFMLGKRLFSYRAGIYAAIMVAIHPIAIVTAHKLFADDMLAFFTALALLLFVIAIQKDNDWFMVLAGISCGLAVLAKQTGGFLLIALFIYTVITHKKLHDIRQLPSVVLNKRILLFSIGVFLISGFWFYKIYQIYGDPLWRPGQPNLIASDASGWFRMLKERPAGWILYMVGIPFMCPLFAFAYLGLRDLVKASIRIIKQKEYDYRFILLWTVILLFGYMLRTGKESRRMLPVYPAIAALAGYYLDRFKSYHGRLSKYIGPGHRRRIIIAVLLVVCVAWSVYLGLDTVLSHRQLIRIPF